MATLRNETYGRPIDPAPTPQTTSDEDVDKPVEFKFRESRFEQTK